MNEVNAPELKENAYDKVISKILVGVSIFILVITIIFKIFNQDIFDSFFDVVSILMIFFMSRGLIATLSKGIYMKYPNSYNIAMWRFQSIMIISVSLSYCVVGFLTIFLLFLSYFIIGIILTVTTASKTIANNQIVNENRVDLPIENTQTTEPETSSIKIATMAGLPNHIIQTQVNTDYQNYVAPESFDEIYKKTEDEMFETFVQQELDKINFVQYKNQIPPEIKKRKYILRIIFSVLLFIYISLFFFHFPKYTYIIGGIILFIVSYTSTTYNFMDYLKKKIKERPDEKISNIVMLETQNMVNDDSMRLSLIGIGIALVASIAIFINPVIIYERTDEGYAVRYYAYGLTNFITAEIPETHNGKPVVSLRGNAFSNMTFLEEVTLPDTITEIRGQAFKNDTKLRKVKLPANLEYLGGSAFYNCTSITEIYLPDTINYIGGNAFYNAKSLKSITLPKNITEIRGGTFEKCSSLEEITIPDNVTSIGGGAFSGATKLAKVKLSENITEIGGEAFYNNVMLKEITLPENLSEIRGSTFENCRSLEEINIPDSVTRIGGHAFYGCSSLKTVTISPYSALTEVGSSAFRLCNSLKEITFPENTIINSKAFKESPTKVYKYQVKKETITDYDM